VELDAGNATGAIPYFKKALELFEASNARSWWHGTAIDLAHAYLDAGQPDEAARVLTKLDPRAGTPKTQTYELSAHARLASARGDHDEALKLVGEALTRSMSDVNPRSQARMLEDVAEINEAAGNTADTRRLLERALELYMAKEYEIGRARVEARLRSLG
jgi:tetratricopeptide (TPR) repeat protein